MLERPRKSRSAFGSFVLFLLLAAVVYGAYSLGDRHGRRVASAAQTVLGQCLATAPAGGAQPSPAFPATSGLPALQPMPGSPAQPGAAVGAPLSAVGAVGGPLVPAPIAGVQPGVDGGASPEGPQHLALTLRGSLDEAIQSAVTTADGPALTMVISRLLVWWCNPSRDARPGDKLWVVYELPPGQEPLVLALRYQSQKLGVTKTAVRYQPPDAPFARYYDESGAELEERLVDSPLEDWEQITSLLRDGRGHKGVDFKVPVGTAVHSPVDGVVTKRNWKVRANGDCLEVEDRKTHRAMIFLHLSEIEPLVRVGTQVTAGMVIAKTGNTGHTTAPHLHYQVMSGDGRVLDPFVVQATTRRSLPPPALPALQKTLAAYLAELGPQVHATR